MNFAIGIIIVYAVIAIVRNAISPKIVGSQLGLHPIVSLLSIYVGYRLLGLCGMIAFPIIIQVLLAMHKRGNIHLFKERRT
ncbi:MAG: AI-2E family transporter [Clostridiales bacterium]|jgi:predicted PurR-regulated permease PerM|nr:AI-2E family transporter [Clostridiales bacterium]